MSASNALNSDVLWGFIRAYAPGASPEANPGLEKLVDSVGGVEVNLAHKLCADIAGGAGGGQGGVTLHLKKGENTLDGEKALAYSRIREPSECPGPGKSAFTFGYDDFDREEAQQAVINGKSTVNYAGYAFRPQDKELLEAVNAELAKVLGSPEHLKILAKYSISPNEVPKGVTTKALCTP